MRLKVNLLHLFLQHFLSPWEIKAISLNPWQIFRAVSHADQYLFVLMRVAGGISTPSTQAGDAAAASEQLALSGATATTRDNNTASANGQLAITGSMVTAQADNTLSATGQGSVAISGALAVSQAGDSARPSGQVAITGAVSATQADNVVAAAGSTWQFRYDIRNPNGQYARVRREQTRPPGTSSPQRRPKHADGNWRVVVVRLSVCDSTRRFSDGFCGAGHRRLFAGAQDANTLTANGTIASIGALTATGGSGVDRALGASSAGLTIHRRST